MYDICRDSLPNRYLSVQEAATLLSFTNNIVTEPIPVRLEDDYELSTGCGRLCNLRVERKYFLNIILNEEASLFMVTPSRIKYIDTQSHGACGPVIVKGSTLNLRAFCNCVWEIKSTYGNLSTLVFSQPRLCFLKEAISPNSH